MTTRRKEGIRPDFSKLDFNRQPFVLAWELTRACNLACVHCRAEAQLRRHPLELSTDEALALVDDIASFDRPPVLILTGGDPMRRPDLVEIIKYATSLGIRCTLTPAGTPLASLRRLQQAKDAGLSRVAVSLDGPTAVEHDRFRRVDGSFRWTLDIIERADQIGLPVQLHTTLSRRTLSDIPIMANLAEELGVVVWAVFCLVPTGRAQREDEITADEYEETFNWLAKRSKDATWNLKLTEGYHFRRILMQRTGESVSGLGFTASDGISRAPKAVNSGNGFCFISHTGEIYPSGFLPAFAGSIREQSIVDIYQRSPVFQDLRNPGLLKGRCGLCQYKEMCGGSRSRAFAHTGDYLSEDPACAFVPMAAS